MASLAAFHAGTLSALCVVDLFNEGVDIPLVDRVVMLRPTESKIVFLQQLGRGLRAAEGKLRLEVIDFVGNHRVFASRLVHLLSLAPAATAADATGFALLKRYLDGREPAFRRAACSTWSSRRRSCSRGFCRRAGPRWRRRIAACGRSSGGGRRRRSFCMLTICLTRCERRMAVGSVFAGARGISMQAGGGRRGFGAWLGMLETTNLNKSYKMVVLRVLLDRDALWDGMEIPKLAAACR